MERGCKVREVLMQFSPWAANLLGGIVNGRFRTGLPTESIIAERLRVESRPRGESLPCAAHL